MTATLDSSSNTHQSPSQSGVGGSVPLIGVTGVGKSYGATSALVDVNLTVEAGRSHAIVGRNGAGKSTLIKILTGLESADTGFVEFSGELAPPLAHREAWSRRVACVHQRSMVVPQLSVLENLMLEAISQGPRTVPWRTLHRQAEMLREQWGLGSSLQTKAMDLSVGERQLLEIARAMRGGNRLILMDEPTAQLQAREIETLFAHIGRLKAEGVTFLYISHHLSEIYEVCDDVSVLRDGRHVITCPVADLPRAQLVDAMVGPQAGKARAAMPATREAALVLTDAPVVLEVRELAGEGFADVSLSVRRGEKVGVAGIAGCGKVALASTIAGLRAPTTGTIEATGRRPAPGRVDDAVAHGIGFVPEDRHANGFCANLSIEENLALAVLPRLSGRLGVVSRSRREALARRIMDDLQIKSSAPGQSVGELSGGNQQKVVVGRALAAEPEVLVLTTPTAGIDVAAKDLLFDLIRRLECGVLLVTDDLEELALCDRILIMFDGTVNAELPAGTPDDQLVAAMEGVGK